MKDKILFWLDNFSPHFGIAKFLQEIHDCELFAIIDVNAGKKFFENQEIISFKKKWYYRDNILKIKEKPNLKYLKSIENKYNINFWKLAFSDQIFNQYNKYYKFSSEEILLIFEQECKFFEKILDEIKPDFLFIRITDYSNIQLLSLICQSRGIKIMTLAGIRVGYGATISTEMDVLDDHDKSVKNHLDVKEYTLEDLQNYGKKYSSIQELSRDTYRVSKIQWFKASITYFIKIILNKNRNYYAHNGKTILKVIKNEVLFSLKKRYRQFFINKNLIKKINLDKKFVYFPLQLEPERTILIPAAFYANQVEVIINIARSLPIEYTLYVKEHPMQKIVNWRNISDYKKILELPNVKFIHQSFSNQEIIKNCSLVMTVTGTSGLEAAFYNKPSIVFGDVVFDVLPSVYKVKNLKELPQIIKTALLQKKVNIDDLNKFMNVLRASSFDFNQSELNILFTERFYYGGFLYDTDISIKDAESFLEENKKIFKMLASEHQKKIIRYKNELK